MGWRGMRGWCASAALLVAVSAPAQTTDPKPVKPAAPVTHEAARHRAAKKAAPAPTTVDVINGTSEHTQTFPEGSRGGKVVGDGANIRVLNGTTWSTTSFKPQATGKGAKTAHSVTQVNVLNGTQAKTQTFTGGIPPPRAGVAPKGKQPVVIGIESSEQKDANARKVVVGIESSETLPRPRAIVPNTAHPKRPPYHPAAKPDAKPSVTLPAQAAPKSNDPKNP